MMHETPADDARLVWQSVRREHPMMSLEEIRTRARAVQSKIHRNLILAFVAGASLLAVSIIAIVMIPSISTRIIAAIMMALTLVMAYQAYSRMWSRRNLSPDASVKGCIDFYRRELEAQYRSVELAWRLLVPLVVFAFLTWNAVIRTNRVVPRVLLLSVLILSLIARSYEVRKINRKVAALDAFDGENSQ